MNKIHIRIDSHPINSLSKFQFLPTKDMSDRKAILKNQKPKIIKNNNRARMLILTKAL